MAIRDNVEGTDQAFCSAVYVALRWKANDGFNPDGAFPAAIGDIAQRAGCSYNKAAEMLDLLASIGVIGVEKQFCAGTKTRSPSLYTFRTLGVTPFRTLGVTPSPQSTGSPVQRLEKEQKENQERVSVKDDTHTPIAPLVLSESEITELAAKFNTTPKGIAEALRDHNAIERRYKAQPTSEGFLAYCHKEGRGVLAKYTTRARNTTAGNAPTAQLPEPDDWRDAVRARAMNPTQADCEWASFDRTQQVAIVKMADEHNREQRTN